MQDWHVWSALALVVGILVVTFFATNSKKEAARKSKLFKGPLFESAKELGFQFAWQQEKIWGCLGEGAYEVQAQIRLHGWDPVHEVKFAGLGDLFVATAPGAGRNDKGPVLETGNERFDQTFVVQAPDEAFALSLLGAPSRKRLVKLQKTHIHAHVRIDKGILGVLSNARLREDEAFVREVSPHLLRELQALIEEMFSCGDSPYERLAHHAVEDANAGFRLRCFGHLEAHEEHRDLAQAVARKWLATHRDDHYLRCRAAQVLEEEVYETCRDALHSGQRDAQELALQMLLQQKTSKPKATKLLLYLLENPHPPLACGALEGLLALGHTPELSVLLEHGERLLRSPLYLDALESHSHHGADPLRLEQLYLQMVEKEKSESSFRVKRLLDKLKQIGSHRSIPGLKAMAEPLRHELKRHFLETIDAIIERCGELSVGGLSLPQEARGALSSLEGVGELSQPEEGEV